MAGSTLIQGRFVLLDSLALVAAYAVSMHGLAKAAGISEITGFNRHNVPPDVLVMTIQARLGV